MPSRLMVLSDGDVPALIACAAAAERSLSDADAQRPLVLPFPSAASARVDAIRAQAEFFSFALLPSPPVSMESADGEGECRDLVSAIYGGARAGVEEIIWPASASRGDEVDIIRLAEITDRALLVGRLVALDSARHESPFTRIDTPYADLSDRQLSELALDLAIPLDRVWWWGGTGGDAAKARARWAGPFAKAGWPLTDAPTS